MSSLLQPLKTLFSKGYARLGWLLLIAFAVQAIGNFNWSFLTTLQANDVYQQLSGFVMVGFLAHQWRCALSRRHAQNTPTRLTHHKLLGAFAPVFFYAHAQHLGYAFLQILSLSYFAIVVTGLCNIELLRIAKNGLRTVWLLVHIGLATGLLFLLGYHVFISYAYE